MKTIVVLLLCSLGVMLPASAQTLKEGSVVAMSTYTLTLNPDVTLNQFFDFFKKKLIPADEKAYPGMKEYVVWGDRGENKNEFGIITVFESVSIRDKYYPVADSETLSEAVKEAEQKLQGLNEEFGKYVMSIERVYTDWIVR